MAVIEGKIPDVRRILDRCVQAGVPAMLGSDPCCGGGCGPKAKLMVRHEDANRVAALLQRDWLEAAAREGTLGSKGIERLISAHSAAPDVDPPCPACGHEGALTLAGACADCGLQLA